VRLGGPDADLYSVSINKSATTRQVLAPVSGIGVFCQALRYNTDLEIKVVKVLITLVAFIAYAQVPDQSPTFEVVSIKPLPSGPVQIVSSGGGPGSRDPGVWTCRNMTLHNILWAAFRLQSQQQVVAPSWMGEPRFDITAKVPAGATRDQLFQMLQNMLIERFGLKFHRGEREAQGYELVLAKGGPKFKESPELPKGTAPNPQPPQPPRPPAFGPDGYPVFAAGVQAWSGGGHRAGGQWPRMSMGRFATAVWNLVDAPVVDATGLSGTYDFSLKYDPNPDQPDADGPTIFAALQDQLGLKLESKKVTIPIIIVDHAERVPTEN
jgi:uncharacterized protein (TIGR03435 family)